MRLNKKNNKNLPRFARQNPDSFGIKILLIVLIIIFALILIVLQRPIRSFFYSASGSLQNWYWEKGRKSSGFWFGFLNANYLKKENENLKKEVQSLLARVAESNQLRKENQELRKALDLGLAKKFQLLEVKILSKDVGQEVVLINKGKKDGIRKGMPVITFEKVLVGKVSEVYDAFSKVDLINSCKIKFKVQVEESGIKGLAACKGSQNLILDLVPKDKELKEGSLIITSGPEGGFPAGLLVGKIKKIKKSDLDIFQKANIELFFDLNNVGSLLVITNWFK